MNKTIFLIFFVVLIFTIVYFSFAQKKTTPNEIIRKGNTVEIPAAMLTENPELEKTLGP